MRIDLIMTLVYRVVTPMDRLLFGVICEGWDLGKKKSAFQFGDRVLKIAENIYLELLDSINGIWVGLGQTKNFLMTERSQLGRYQNINFTPKNRNTKIYGFRVPSNFQT